MKIIQTIGGFGAKGGGTSTCTYDLLSAVHSVKPNECVDLLTPDVTDPTDKIMGVGEDWIKVEPNDYKTPLSISKNLSEFLKSNDYDIYHTNGMWMHINHITCAIARKRNKPYIITPHGMLYPEALARSAWKKWPMSKLWFDKDIREASCIHVTCEDEMKHVRAFGYHGPIALIGNPVAVPDYTEDLYSHHVNENHHFNSIAYLGRLHPRKKIENILYGMTKASTQIDAYIIGKGDEAYEKFLQDEAIRLGIANRVHFLGFLNGKDKFEQLAKVDALFVPSDMENFGMIIPEALIVGTPVMASLGTPWSVLNEEHCGWWKDNSSESIAKIIDEIYSVSIDELHEMGKRGREYVINNYSGEVIAEQMIQLYKWILGEGEKPGFVDLYTSSYSLNDWK